LEKTQRPVRTCPQTTFKALRHPSGRCAEPRLQTTHRLCYLETRQALTSPRLTPAASRTARARIHHTINNITHTCETRERCPSQTKTETHTHTHTQTQLTEVVSGQYTAIADKTDEHLADV